MRGRLAAGMPPGRAHAVRTAAGVALSTAVLLAAGGCAMLGGTTQTSATARTTASHSPTASPSTYSPLSGPIEAAAQLPKECSQILTSAQLQAVFGAGMPIGDDYGSYAPLPTIGRTGRVACVFGVGLDSFGQQSTGDLEVAIATYTSAAEAVGRAADTVQSDSQAGATTASVSVGGHPATIVVEQGAVGASASASPPAGTPVLPPASASASSGTAPATVLDPATATATASAGPPAASGSPTAAAGGETELVMADGNRTFVLQAPFAKLPAQQALTALTGLALEAYQNTLSFAPSSAPGAPASPSRG